MLHRPVHDEDRQERDLLFGWEVHGVDHATDPARVVQASNVGNPGWTDVDVSDRAGLPEGGDVGRAEADLVEDLVGVLAKQRWGGPDGAGRLLE